MVSGSGSAVETAGQSNVQADDHQRQPNGDYCPLCPLEGLRRSRQPTTCRAARGTARYHPRGVVYETSAPQPEPGRLRSISRAGISMANATLMECRSFPVPFL